MIPEAYTDDSATTEPYRIDSDLLAACREHFPRAPWPAAMMATYLRSFYKTGMPIRHGDWALLDISRGQATRTIAEFERIGWVRTWQAEDPGADSRHRMTWIEWTR